MADVAVLFDTRDGAWIAVHDTAVLDVAAGLHHQAAKIPAQAGARADIDSCSDDHVADQYRRRVHEGAGMHHRNQAFKGIHIGHGALTVCSDDAGSVSLSHACGHVSAHTPVTHLVLSSASRLPCTYLPCA